MSFTDNDCFMKNVFNEAIFYLCSMNRSVFCTLKPQRCIKAPEGYCDEFPFYCGPNGTFVSFNNDIILKSGVCVLDDNSLFYTGKIFLRKDSEKIFGS